MAQLYHPRLKFTIIPKIKPYISHADPFQHRASSVYAVIREQTAKGLGCIWWDTLRHPLKLTRLGPDGRIALTTPAGRARMVSPRVNGSS